MMRTNHAPVIVVVHIVEKRQKIKSLRVTNGAFVS